MHLLLVLAALLCAPAAGFAHGVDVAEGTVGILENLGGQVPRTIRFIDENGRPVELGSLITTPTILALVYYRCPNACDYLLTGLAGTIKNLDAVPGRDYRVITISIDERETPADARKARRISLESIERPFPPEDWRFLTGSEASITAVADAVGFHYVRRGDVFDHPVGIIVLSPSARIVRYMDGADFLPADVKLSFLEASRGRVGPTIARVLRYCFAVDPKSHRLVFNLLRVVATVTLSLAAAFIAYLIISGLKRRDRANRPSA